MRLAFYYIEPLCYAPMGNDERGYRNLNPINGGGREFDPDELIRRVKKYFSGGGGGPSGSMKSYGAIAIGLLLVIMAFTCFYTVDVSEEGVVTRFGRYHSTTPPGLHFKLPFFVDRVIKVPSKVLLQEEFGFRSTGQRDSRTSYSKRAYTQESLMLTRARQYNGWSKEPSQFLEEMGLQPE